ncbi:succinate-semialdehyde dehydrogenase / glutarate-semialdehyde dehydrogenase [Rubrimonas cliftonensis]|uniref:Succinate-semialdehyde dehydrogenase / glutarate-semialdehyde dehydrogenase n=2 Tax=Rubrimonas cliftonensis TaxID=89524 RepID=A0A1H3X781_9RHOB|nr:succinate-semialdehyde dehydrogenase / glutarate-semialdehyde dehydrogenase [Rubrimonas cliftonensis]
MAAQDMTWTRENPRGWRDFMIEQCLVGDAWSGADDGSTLDVNDPSTGDRLGTAPKMGRAETARAVDRAQQAFRTYSAMPAAERGALMMKLHGLMIENQAALGELLCREMGKPLAEAKGEIAYGAAFVKWFAEEARRVYGDMIPSPWADKRIMVTHAPVGVVGAITPWNFPNAMIARKLGAALGAGCTMVCKPASATPYSAIAMAKLVEEAGFPAGTFSVVTGSAREIAAELCENPLVRKITFTGSTEVGKELASNALRHMKKVSMELGGNAPFIVFDDADLDAAVDGAIASKFRNAGQTCVCANRLFVQAGVHDAFVEKLVAAVEKLKVGRGYDEGVTQGPLIDRAAVEKVQEHVSDMVAGGATVLTGGEAAGGTFYRPTVVTGARPGMKVFAEETFGPVAPVFRFSTEAEAIAMANDTPFGLASYFYTRDLGRAFRVMEALEYGIVGVNSGIISTEVAPFGGVKDSGMGSEGSKYGLDDYMVRKYALIGGLAG